MSNLTLKNIMGPTATPEQLCALWPDLAPSVVMPWPAAKIRRMATELQQNPQKDPTRPWAQTSDLAGLFYSFELQSAREHDESLQPLLKAEQAVRAKFLKDWEERLAGQPGAARRLDEFRRDAPGARCDEADRLIQAQRLEWNRAQRQRLAEQEQQRQDAQRLAEEARQEQEARAAVEAAVLRQGALREAQKALERPGEQPRGFWDGLRQRLGLGTGPQAA